MTASPTYNHVEELLLSLAVLSDRTEAAEQNILDAPVARREVVLTRLEAIRTDAMRHAGEEYQALIRERAELERVIALAKERL